MENLGTILVVFGVIGALVSGLLLSAKGEEGDEGSGWWLADAFILGGLISIIRGLAKGVSDVFYRRSSTSLVLVLIFFVSVLMIVTGLKMDE